MNLSQGINHRTLLRVIHITIGIRSPKDRLREVGRWIPVDCAMWRDGQELWVTRTSESNPDRQFAVYDGSGLSRIRSVLSVAAAGLVPE